MFRVYLMSMDQIPDDVFPLAYLITLRSYGTWLHGDERTSVDRHGYNVYGTPRRAPNIKLEQFAARQMRSKPYIFTKAQRTEVERLIAEVCLHRGYDLKVVRMQSNHFHAVVSARLKPEPIMNAFKSYATRGLRKAGMVDFETKLWARKGSRRYLWKQLDVDLAIDYVINFQDF